MLQYLKDMFDHDKVRFVSCASLAEDILRLSHRRSDILLGYLGIDSLIASNGALPSNSTHSSTLELDAEKEEVNTDGTREWVWDWGPGLVQRIQTGCANNTSKPAPHTGPPEADPLGGPAK